MFAGFNLDFTNSTNAYGREIIDFSKYKDKGKKHLNSQKEYYKKRLEEYVINGTGTINGSQLQADWFPEIEADVFLSHSHKDLELAQSFAGWLNEKFGLRCFIDANVWGYADELLEEINSEYSDKRYDKDGGYLYSYSKCNVASKHVNIMLSIALQKMIDKLEATFVLNTVNSVQKYEKVHKDSTYSPWIYTEIICTEIVRKKPLSEYRKLSTYKFANENATKDFQAVYTVSLNHLFSINPAILKKWEDNFKEGKFPLDTLYLLMGEEGVKELSEFCKIYPKISMG